MGPSIFVLGGVPPDFGITLHLSVYFDMNFICVCVFVAICTKFLDDNSKREFVRKLKKSKGTKTVHLGSNSCALTAPVGGMV